MSTKFNDINDISIISDGNIDLTTDATIYLNSRIGKFDISKLFVEIKTNIYFEVLISYSFDKQNWSNPVTQESWEEINGYFLDTNITALNYIYIAVNCRKIIFDNNIAETLKITPNIDNTIPRLTISEISYDNYKYNFNDESEISIITYYQLVNLTPKWNLYDNQQSTIKRWLDTCAALCHSHGLPCIYFKTSPIDSEISHTFSNHVMRNVVAIKKLMIMNPGNELPQDKTVYSDWDMPLIDDFVIHIVDSLFEQAFGLNQIPQSKDYIFYPIINKLFRLTSPQRPQKGYMGKYAWWECYLQKYEEDETVTIGDEIREAMSSEFEMGLSNFNIIEQLEDFKDDTIYTAEKIDENSIDEKKIANQNFSNRLVDSTMYIDLKETEIQRKFYSKRLNIVSINPDNNAFPVTMYNCQEVTNRVVALTYDLKDAVSINKHSLICENNFDIMFNYVLMTKFGGEIIDIEGGISIVSKRTKQIEIISHKYQTTSKVLYEFEENEFYHIHINFSVLLTQLSIKIYKLHNRQKKLVYQDVYIIGATDTNPHNMKFSNIYVYGGKYLLSEIIFKNNENTIITDNVNPVLIMSKFGT